MLAAARRGGAAARLLSQIEPSSLAALQRQPGQQAAAYAKKGESVDSRLQNVLKMLEPRQVEEIELSKEDYEEATRRAKEYSRHKMAEHRAWQADLTQKLQLKLAAVAALPPHLRAAAEVPDDELFPLNRHLWNETPPIEGFGQDVVPQAAGARRMGTKHHQQR